MDNCRMCYLSTGITLTPALSLKGEGVTGEDGSRTAPTGVDGRGLRWIPACAGMTKVVAGMGEVVAGMGDVVASRGKVGKVGGGHVGGGHV